MKGLWSVAKGPALSAIQRVCWHVVGMVVVFGCLRVALTEVFERADLTT